MQECYLCIKFCILYTKNITMCHFKPITDLKTRYTNLTNKFGIFCRVRTFCAYTQPYGTVNVAKDTVAV